MRTWTQDVGHTRDWQYQLHTHVPFDPLVESNPNRGPGWIAAACLDVADPDLPYKKLAGLVEVIQIGHTYDGDRSLATAIHAQPAALG